MDTLLKERVIALVNNCDDEDKLRIIESNLLVENKTDWWDELTEEDKERIFESEKQVADGDYYTQEQVHEMMQQWRGK